MNRITGAILAGGTSRRMGTDKALVRIGSKTMLEHVSGALSGIVTQVVISGRPQAGYQSISDRFGGDGPIAGIASVLATVDTPHVLVVSVDLPFVRADTLQRLATGASDLPIVPVDDDGVRQVTCAVFPKAIARQAKEEAQQGGTVQSLLDRVSFQPVTPTEWRGWGEDGRSWFSVDDENALQRGLALYS